MILIGVPAAGGAADFDPCGVEDVAVAADGEPIPSGAALRARHEEWLIRKQRITIRAMILTLAVCMAPFLALVFGITAALRCLALGCYSPHGCAGARPNHVGVVACSKLRMAGGLNLVMALVVFLIVWVRLA